MRNNPIETTKHVKLTDTCSNWSQEMMLVGAYFCLENIWFSEATHDFLGMHSMDVNRPLTRWLIDNVESARDRLAKSEPIRYEVKTMTSAFLIA